MKLQPPVSLWRADGVYVRAQAALARGSREAPLPPWTLVGALYAPDGAGVVLEVPVRRWAKAKRALALALGAPARALGPAPRGHDVRVVTIGK